jgi:Ca2+-binding RTX toxin-like protein
VDGGPGDDFLFGGVGDDHARGSFGHDMINGGAGSDACFGERAVACEPLEKQGLLHPGTYTFDALMPAVTLRVGEGWTLLTAGDFISLFFGAEEYGFSTVDFVISQAPTRVYDISIGRPQETSARAPDDLTLWLSQHQYLDTSPITDTVIGGVAGRQIDIRLVDIPSTDFPSGRSFFLEEVDCPLWETEYGLFQIGIGDVRRVIDLDNGLLITSGLPRLRSRTR